MIFKLTKRRNYWIMAIRYWDRSVYCFFYEEFEL